VSTLDEYKISAAQQSFSESPLNDRPGLQAGRQASIHTLRVSHAEWGLELPCLNNQGPPWKRHHLVAYVFKIPICTSASMVGSHIKTSHPDHKHCCTFNVRRKSVIFWNIDSSDHRTRLLSSCPSELVLRELKGVSVQSWYLSSSLCNTVSGFKSRSNNYPIVPLRVWQWFSEVFTCPCGYTDHSFACTAAWRLGHTQQWVSVLVCTYSDIPKCPRI